MEVGPEHDREALEGGTLSRQACDGHVQYVLLEYAHLGLLLFMSVMSSVEGSRFRCGPLCCVALRKEKDIQVSLNTLFPFGSKVSTYEYRVYSCHNKTMLQPTYLS